MSKIFNSTFNIGGNVSQTGLDVATLATPFRIVIKNPDTETVTVQIAIDDEPAGGDWETIGTVAGLMGSVIVTAPVPKLRIVGDGGGANVLAQVVGVSLAP